MASGELFGADENGQRAPETVRGTAKKSPDGPVLVAHCDGGARGNPGPAGYGAVIADAQGGKLAELSEFLGNRTNNYAEYSGLLGVLAWTIEHGHRHLRVVSDSELMVKQIQGRYKVNSPDLRPLFEEARRRIAKLDSFQITHALRHKNKDADRLANEAMDRGTGRTQDPPVHAPTAPAAPAASKPVSSPLGAGSRSPLAVQARDSSGAPTMLRGFVRGGTVHLLGGKTLPEGSFVKILPE